jgi:3-dehydroquinate synthase
MHGAALLSYHLGLCSADTLGKVKDVLAFYKLPLTAPQCSPEGLQAFLVRDKKSVQGKINWVLVKTIGQVVISDQVPDAVLQQVLTEITATS